MQTTAGEICFSSAIGPATVSQYVTQQGLPGSNSFSTSHAAGNAGGRIKATSSHAALVMLLALAPAAEREIRIDERRDGYLVPVLPTQSCSTSQPTSPRRSTSLGLVFCSELPQSRRARHSDQLAPPLRTEKPRPRRVGVLLALRLEPFPHQLLNRASGIAYGTSRNQPWASSTLPRTRRARRDQLVDTGQEHLQHGGRVIGAIPNSQIDGWRFAGKPSAHNGPGQKRLDIGRQERHAARRGHQRQAPWQSCLRGGSAPA